MTTYNVSGTVTVSCFTEVEADSPEEAIRIAASRSIADIHIDGSYELSECFHIDADGEPQGLHAEEQHE